MKVSESLIYWYRATVRRIYDGDTIHVDIDLGLNTKLLHQKIRLARINAPELKGRSRRRGRESRAALESYIPINSKILLNTVRDGKGKYGRWLAEIWKQDPEAPAGQAEFENINDKMIATGQAKPMEKKS